MLGQRRRRWHNIKPALGERLVFAGMWEHSVIRSCYSRYIIAAMKIQKAVTFNCRVASDVVCAIPSEYCIEITGTMILSVFYNKTISEFDIKLSFDSNVLLTLKVICYVTLCHISEFLKRYE